MRILLVILASILLFIGCHQAPIEQKTPTSDVIHYDSLKANQLGADNYGMKTYVMAFLLRGPNQPKDSAHSASLQKAHLENIGKLANEGKLVLAGPFYGNDSLRGIYVFNVSSLDEAKELTLTDPAINYGSLKMDLKKWYGSAALMEVNKIHQQIAKINI